MQSGQMEIDGVRPVTVLPVRVHDEIMSETGVMPSGRHPGQHQVVAAMLLRADSVLLCHRSSDRAWYPDVWDLPGGHIETNESQETRSFARSKRSWVSLCPGRSGDTRSRGRPRSSRCESGRPVVGRVLRRTVRRTSTMRSAGLPNERYVPCAWQTTRIAVGSPKPCPPNDQGMHRGRLQVTHRPIKNRFGTSPVAAAICPDSR
jgi:8-oxo-dGTP pyrophosphatase MutT (NUDIX family)